ncbi:hypothetical protein [Hydrocarboniphaga effusa]|uniref:hypothetical protein n=1 Tax=Hydrocarboniphaga effusa TaxID=243629 RepID=UPI003BAACFD8
MSQIKTFPGLWREAHGLRRLVRLDVEPVTAGMVVVASVNDDWQSRPELRFQTWPESLSPDTDLHGTDYPTPAEIEAADVKLLARWYRFLGSPLNENDARKMERICERFRDAGGMTPELSKSIGLGSDGGAA